MFETENSLRRPDLQTSMANGVKDSKIDNAKLLRSASEVAHAVIRKRNI